MLTVVAVHPHLLVEVLRFRGMSAHVQDEDDGVVRVLAASVVDVTTAAARNCLPVTIAARHP